MRGSGQRRDNEEMAVWQGRSLSAAGASLGLGVFAFAVAGYHPYAEDGGVYLAGVEKLLRPELFPLWTDFVTEHLRFSLFAPMMAGLVRGSHVPLGWVLLCLYFFGIAAALYAGWMVAARVTGCTRGRLGAVALLACWLTLPIAGTSLILIDPYVTARTISTPLVLMAVAWALDRTGRGWALCGLALVSAAAVHPLMAGYGLAAVLVIACMGARQPWVRRWGPWGLGLAALGVAGLLQAFAPAESADYLRIAITRYYWFVSRWQWFEWLGLAGPVAVLAGLLAWRGTVRERDSFTLLARAAMVLGAIAFAVACCFAREGLATHLVARLQPLRCFQMVYEVMILLLGVWLGEVVLRGRVWRWAVMLVVLGGLMSFVQTQIYASSAHVEWPGTTPRNAWERAFLWVRSNTPEDALFALDARYITRGRGEDAQCFRAIAERSALADYSKDGGEASITPALTSAWVTGVNAQAGLETESDAGRLQKLRPLGVGWVVLESGTATGWSCPYQNERVKVCRLP